MRRDEIREQLEYLNHRIAWLVKQITRLIRVEGRQVAAIDELTAQVAATTGAQASAVVAINGLADKIDELIAAGNSDPALIALRDELMASTNALAAAVVENPIP